MKKLLLSIFFVLLFAVNGFSANYYVCDTGADCNAGAGSGWSTGDDGNNGTTKATPWKTIQQAANTIVAGDTVTVGDGTYHDTETLDSTVFMTTDGTSGSWITFRSENKHGAILDGQNSREACFYLYGANYIRLEGFETKNANLGIMLSHPSSSTHDVYIYQCKIHGMGRNILDTSCTVNRAYAGITGKATNYNITVDSCMVFDIGRQHNAVYCTHDYKHDHGIYAIGKSWLIKNNLIYNMYSGWAIKVSGHAVSMEGATHTIVNNTFAHKVNDGPYAGAHIIYSTDNGIDPHDIILDNNVFYDPPMEYVDAAIRTNCNLDDCVMRNNSTSTTNLYYQAAVLGTPTTANNTTSLALAGFKMVDPANNDFNITDSTSPLIDTGLSTNAPAYDYIGTVRPQGNGDDIGAYEYSLYIYNASPAQNDSGVSIMIDPSWTNPTAENTNDGYFKVGACPCDAGDSVWTNQAHQTTYNPGTLAYNTAHCWRVDIDHDGGTEAGTNYGFTTTSQANPPTPEGSGMVYHKQGVTIVHHDKGMGIQ